MCNGPVSAFDNVDLNALLSSAPPANSQPRKVRPSITVDDSDAPSVSFAAAKPMSLSRKGSSATVDEEPAAEASFTLKTPRRSSSIVPPDA